MSFSFYSQGENECICLDVKSFEYAKSFKYASLQAVAHSCMQQFRILFLSKALHQMKVYSCFKHLHTPPILPRCTWAATPSFPGWVLKQKAVEQCQSPFHYPEVFQVNNPKSHEKNDFGLPLQGADILKSKHSGQAETEPLNALK